MTDATGNPVVPKPAPNPWLVRSLVLGFILAFALLVPLLVVLWNLVGDDGTDSASINLVWAWAPVNLDQEAGLIAIVAVAGALGSFIHAVQSLTDYLGNRRFGSSWAAWYVMRLPLGAVLAILFYFVVRAGLISTDATGEEVNPFGVVALGGLAGLFAKQATDKLREVFETLFRVSPGKGDDERADSLTNPLPVLRDLQPDEVRAGTEERHFRLMGRRFIPETQATLEGKPLDCKFVDENELRVTVEAPRMANAGVRRIVVSNPAPGGGSSEPVSLRVVRKRRFGR